MISDGVGTRSDDEKFRIADYLSNTNVQLGASYAIGQQSTRLYGEGCKAAAKYINADPNEVGI